MTTSLLIRKAHRYLGLFIGIQFLGWTISGLYFSWNNIDNVHGDHLRKNPHFIATDDSLASPYQAIQVLRSQKQVDSIAQVTLTAVAGKPLYQISYFSGHTGDVHLHTYTALADARTGSLRGPLSQEEALEVAIDQVQAGATISSVEYLEEAGKHHEYRGRPLPAYAVNFKDPDCTVYVSPERGSFQTIRHSQWRIFDFLWMFHTMDYQSRDDFNNWLLKIFSAFGLITVVSGFALFMVSSRRFTRKR